MGITLIVGDQTVTLSAKAANVSLSTYIPGPPGPPGPSGATSFPLPTNSPIGGNRAIATVNGFAVYADCSVMGLEACGLSMSAVSGGTDVTVQNSGKMTVTGAGWVVDAPIYLSTAGVLTQIEPVTGFSQVIGRAFRSDVIIIDIQRPIILA